MNVKPQICVEMEHVQILMVVLNVPVDRDTLLVQKVILRGQNIEC